MSVGRSAPGAEATGPALEALATRYGLSARAVDQLATLLELLSRDPSAPSSVTEPERAVDVHLADSLVALEVHGVRAAQSIADLGAGAGFPGLALAAALPTSHVFLVESASRKCVFLRRAVQAMELSNVDVVCQRAEEWQAGMGAHDLVSARALAVSPIVLEYAAPLLRRRGRLIQWRGRRAPEDEAAAERVAESLGFGPTQVRAAHPFPGALHRHLHVHVKVGQTPEGFPRRAGMARKRPLAR